MEPWKVFKSENHHCLNLEKAEIDWGREGENKNTGMRDKLHLFSQSLNSLASCHLQIMSRVCFGTYVCPIAVSSQAIKVRRGKLTKRHPLFAFLVSKLIETIGIL